MLHFELANLTQVFSAVGTLSSTKIFSYPALRLIVTVFALLEKLSITGVFSGEIKL